MKVFILKSAFLIIWISCYILRYKHIKHTKRNKISVNQKTTKEKALLGFTSLGMMLLPLISIFSDLFDFASYKLPIVFQATGLVLLPVSFWLFYRSHKDLGKNWSATLEIREEHKLVTKGIYNSIRHPMYSAIWLWVICQALLIDDYIGGLAGIISFGLLYLLRVKEEEAMMKEEFGQEYIEYMSKTNRLIPKI